MRTCSIEGCNRKYRAKGYCTSHYDKWRRLGNPLATKNEKVCSIEGCNEKHKAKGYCKTHYDKYRKRGDPLYEFHPKGRKCSVESCFNKHTAKGYCSTHYSRFLAVRNGSKENYEKIANCTIEGCNNPHIAKGYCKSHYDKYRRHGDPLYEHKPTGKCHTEKCLVEGCNKPYKSNGYCGYHFNHWYRNGDPEKLKKPLQSKPIHQRISERVLINDSGCWEFQGQRNRVGYGVISYKGRAKMVHRIVYELITCNNLKQGDVILHKCDNPPCCNPKHLLKGTLEDNVADKVLKGRQARGSSHPKAKFTETEVKAIRDLYSTEKYSIGMLAEMFDVYNSTISNIISRKTWKHIK